jgi:hypothetical protein
VLSVRTSINLAAFEEAAAAALQSESPVFLDTNMLSWCFRLAPTALRDFTNWLDDLRREKRLLIPAWVVHEYNDHLITGNVDFVSPHKGITKTMEGHIAELDRIAHLQAGDELATQLGYADRQGLLQAMSTASNTLQKIAKGIERESAEGKRDLLDYLEGLTMKCGLRSNIHDLAIAATRESAARYPSRLAPGYHDAEKLNNSVGDLIIWKEILDYCISQNAKRAVLLTNDRKSDWVYSPSSVILRDGRRVSGTSPIVRHVKLPKPDLLDEFEEHTGGGDLHILSIDSVISILSSPERSIRSQEFRNLALGIKISLTRTPTEAVINWFLTHEDKYTQAVRGVCGWHSSPSEVDQNAFREWTTTQMGKDLDPTGVEWTTVFCELFL